MLSRLLHRYRTNRLWNINANIVLADVVSTATTALVIEGVHARMATPLIEVVVTALIDGGISLVLFAALHTYANRSRGVRDLFRVQVHRWALGPLHYAVGSGMQYVLLRAGVGPGVSVLIAYLSAVVVARTAHTLYGKRSGLFR